MVDPAPNLRNLIADAIYERDSGVYVDDLSDAVLAVLKRHPKAVLATIGTVREGHLYTDQPEWFVFDYRSETIGKSVPVFVVSLGAAAKETTDAD